MQGGHPSGGDKSEAAGGDCDQSGGGAAVGGGPDQGRRAAEGNQVMEGE